jgi:hypothetical protein
MPACQFCQRRFKSDRSTAAHISQSLYCKQQQDTRLSQKISAQQYVEEGGNIDTDPLRYHEGGCSPTKLLKYGKSASSTTTPADDLSDSTEDEMGVVEIHPTAALELPKRQRAKLEMDYEDIVTDQQPWGPFPSQADMDLAEWVKTETVSEGAVSRLLAIHGLHSLSLASKSSRDINDYVDKLPGTTNFQHHEFKIDGQHIPFDCFYRNALDLVKELLGDPTFAGHLLFHPVRQFTDKGKRCRQYTEWNTGEWAWEIQVRHAHHCCTHKFNAKA